MGQCFRVLQCVDCFLFQVAIQNKAFKWMCKVCGCKQSLGRIYMEGTDAKLLRCKVQALNRSTHETTDPEERERTDDYILNLLK